MIRYATIVAFLALLASCSSSGGAAKTSAAAPPSSPPATSSQPAPSSTPTSTPTSSTTAPSSSGAATSAAGLLTVADLGGKFKQDPPDNSPETALPCTPSAPPLFTQVPPKSRVTVSFSGTTEQVGINEDLAVFADASSARKAVTVSDKGFACKNGTIDGNQKITFTASGAIKVSGTAVDSAKAWDFTGAQFKGTAILMRIGTKLVGLVLAAAPNAGTDTDIQGIVDAAAKRAAAAG